MSYTRALTAQTFSLIDTLYAYGMKELVISPGSRSTPLAIAAELHEGIKTYIHPDERGAGYFAIGLSKNLVKLLGFYVRQEQQQPITHQQSVKRDSVIFL